MGLPRFLLLMRLYFSRGIALFFLIDIKCWENEITVNAYVIRHECKQQIHEESSGKCEGDCKEAIKLKGVQGILKFPACYHACIIRDNEQATVWAMCAFDNYIDYLLFLLSLSLLWASSCCLAHFYLWRSSINTVHTFKHIFAADKYSLASFQLFDLKHRTFFFSQILLFNSLQSSHIWFVIILAMQERWLTPPRTLTSAFGRTLYGAIIDSPSPYPYLNTKIKYQT